MRELVIRSNERQVVVAKLRRLLEDPDDLAKAIGALLQAHSTNAFLEQSLGPYDWPEQYPDQLFNFHHKAGIVADFMVHGRDRPRPQRFARKDALMDTGELFRSIKDQSAVDTPDSFTAVVGTQVDYADTHQFGGWSKIPVTEDGKARMRAWLESDQGADYYLSMAWVTRDDVTEYATEVHERPFLGVDGVEDRIVDVIERGLVDVPTRPG